MKAKELMIGDWVMHPLNNDYRKIEGVYYDKELHCLVATDGRFPQNHFEPIPLTPEILTKNGFEHMAFGQVAYPSSNNWKVIVHYYDLECEIYNPVLKHIDAFSIQSVHELQRVLRCCGLWELADNFKI